MYNLIKGMALLLAIAFLFPSFKAHAIYQIYKCNITYTRIDGGAWSANKTCYVTGYGAGAGGVWSIPQDREPAQFDGWGTIVYLDENGNEISQQNAVESCLSNSTEQLESCRRVVTGSIVGGTLLCSKLSGWQAVVCGIVLVGGTREGDLLCDRWQVERVQACNTLTSHDGI